MNTKKHKKFLIGKNDIANLPAFGLSNIKVKVDTGAYTSTIHCSNIKETKSGLEVVFLEEHKNGYTGESQCFREFQFKKVRSSNGSLQNRYIIEGNISLFGEIFTTPFTLSERKLMRYPILLGRKLLNKKFLIDTSKTNQSYKFENKKSV